MKDDIKKEFETAVSPVMRLLGHSMATAVGFAGLALISMVPLGVLQLLVHFGWTELAQSMHALESLLFFGDLGLFALVMLRGVVVFLVEVVVATKQDIKKALNHAEETES